MIPSLLKDDIQNNSNVFCCCKNTHKLKHPSQSVEKKENQISVGTFSANDDFTTVDYLVIKVVKEVTKTEDKT